MDPNLVDSLYQALKYSFDNIVNPEKKQEISNDEKKKIIAFILSMIKKCPEFDTDLFKNFNNIDEYIKNQWSEFIDSSLFPNNNSNNNSNELRNNLLKYALSPNKNLQDKISSKFHEYLKNVGEKNNVGGRKKKSKTKAKNKNKTKIKIKRI